MIDQPGVVSPVKIEVLSGTSRRGKSERDTKVLGAVAGSDKMHGDSAQQGCFCNLDKFGDERKKG